MEYSYKQEDIANEIKTSFTEKDQYLLSLIFHEIINPLIDQLNALRTLHNLPDLPKPDAQYFLRKAIEHKRNL